MNRRSKGKLAEDIAVCFLENNGYLIVERNFQTRRGEIDIIARIKDILCFVEVKSGITGRFGAPIERITQTKINKIVQTTDDYIYRNKIRDMFIRFDVILVEGEKITHLTDAFRAPSPDDRHNNDYRR